MTGLSFIADYGETKRYVNQGLAVSMACCTIKKCNIIRIDHVDEVKKN